MNLNMNCCKKIFNVFLVLFVVIYCCVPVLASSNSNGMVQNFGVEDVANSKQRYSIKFINNNSYSVELFGASQDIVMKEENSIINLNILLKTDEKHKVTHYKIIIEDELNFYIIDKKAAARFKMPRNNIIVIPIFNSVK